MVVGNPEPYVENPDHVPSPTAMRGTLDTSGVGGKQYDYDEVVDVFAVAREQEANSPEVEHTVSEVPSAGVGDQTVVTGTLDTTGTGEPQSPQAPVVTTPDEDPSKVGGSEVVGAGTDEAATQGTLDTTGTDEPTTPSAEVVPNEPVDPDEAEAKAAEDAEAQAQADAEAKAAAEEPFTPVGRTVAAVEKYLADADEEERERVLAIEAESDNPRTTLTEGKYAKKA